VTRLLAALLALGLALPARAEPCGHEDRIAAMARDVLAARADLTGFAPRQVGALPAYLLLHYGGLADAEARALLDGLVAERVREAADLADARAIATDGVTMWQARRGLADAEAIARTDMAARRAILLADDGATFFRLLAAAPPGDPALGILLQGPGILALLTDQPDDRLLAIAVQAEAAGALKAAQLLLADRTDLAAYRDFQARHPDADLHPDRQLHAMGATLRHDTGPLDAASYPDAASRQQQRDIHTVVRAAFLMGAADFLGITYNQTGDVAVADAARRFLAAVDGGEIDPVRDPESGWLLAYRALAEAMGPARAQAVLRAFAFPSRRTRHYAGQANETLDWVVARDALAPVVAAFAAMPDRPGLLSPDADWDAWTRTAEALRDGTPTDPADSRRAIELLAAIGDWDAAHDLASALPAGERAAVLTDLAQRLDRQCGQWTATPGQALLLGGSVLWRFPADRPTLRPPTVRPPTVRPLTGGPP
jgi:hypothetical protein